MAYELIEFEVAGGVATITLNRESLNWLNIAMMEEINSALDSLKDQVIKVLVFKAKGKAFSVGVEVAEHMGGLAEKMIEVFHGMFRRMDDLGLLSVAVVGGQALGGGRELATYCDLVVASDKAKFGQPEIQVGVYPPIAALAFPRMIGLKKSLELILGGGIITAQEARELGLVNIVVPPEELDETAAKFIGQFTKLSAPVLKYTRKAVFDGLLDDPGKALDKIEDIYLNQLMKTADAQEGLQAFLDKRKPEWTDK
jgi:cyclohexa-1,5-dienecarbonyl-CoA hydratase